VLDLITRDLAAALAAEAVLLALWDRQSVVLLSPTDAPTDVDPAVVGEGKGFVGRALRLGRAAVEPADRALLASKARGGGVVAPGEPDLERLE